MFVQMRQPARRAAKREMAAGPSDDAAVLTTTSWEDRSWWSGALHKATVIDYFAHSPFYDRTCLNEQLRMQRTLTPKDVAEKLSRLPGIIYEVDEQRTDQSDAPRLYVVRKLRRDTTGRAVPLRFYYILDGVVYEAPSLAAVMRTRLLKMAWHLNEAWREATGANPQQGKKRRRKEGEDAKS